MSYLDQEGKVVYKEKDGKSCRTFAFLEWLFPPLAGCSHIPTWGESRRWRECATTAAIAMSRGENGRRTVAVTSFAASSNHNGMEKSAVEFAAFDLRMLRIRSSAMSEMSGPMGIIGSIQDPSAIRRITFFRSVMLNYCN